MRFHILVLVTLLGAVAACDQPPHAGEEGYVCRSGITPSLCDEGLRCLDDKCVPCGQPGEVCCSTPGGPLHCDGLVACVDQIDGPGTCDGDCGAVGLACCGDDCPVSGTCNFGECTGEGGGGGGGGGLGPECQSGGEAHTVAVILADCSVQLVTFHTDSAAEAETCRQQLVAGAGQEICPLDQKPTENPVCKTSMNGNDQLYLWSCSDAQLASCEQFFCPVDCSWASGSCPMP